MKRNILIVIPITLVVIGLASISRGSGEQAENAGHGSEAVQTDQAEDITYTCPMHPEEVSSEPGKCSICGMNLVPMEGERGEEQEKVDEQAVEEESDVHQGHSEEGEQGTASDETLYHCSMHPTYISENPGECPICGMTLVPIEEVEGGESKVEGRSSVKVNPDKQQLIGVTFDTARVSDLSMKIRTVGRLTYDETKIVKVHTRISGWVERLHVDYTGKEVEKGESLFSIYSPQLYSTQEEYLLALNGERLLANRSMTGDLDNDQSLSAATKRRLELWDISDEQIKELEKSGKAEVNLEIVSPINGFVIEKNAFEGRYVSPGDILYTIADLDEIWALADIYEYELPYVKVGQEAKITLSYYPGEEFTGKVTYVYPYLNNDTRTAQVRFEIDNPNMKLKPDMFVNVKIEIGLGERLTIPRDAILFSGERRIAYVKNGDTTFEPREIETGVQNGQFVEVLEGIEEGEMVVTSANFLIDSESQLRASVMSMMSGHSGHGGH